jgi:4-hydroxy-2-oxoheptanedioate aldolase
MRKNSLKAKLNVGEKAYGVFVNYPSPALVEVAGYLGFDLVFIDAEHGPMDMETCEHMVRAAHCAGITPILRLPYPDPAIVNRYLDTGAMGILFPHLDSVERAKAMVAGAKYHPMGHRGAGANTRAAEYGMTLSGSEYAAWSNEETMIFSILEDAYVLPVLPDILKVEGLDGFAIGLADLSQSLGMPGQTNDPQVQKTLDQIVDLIKKSGKLLSRSVRNEDTVMEEARREMDRGANLIMISIHTLLKRSIKQFLPAKADLTSPSRT